jgi:hypothetical protein
MSKLKKLAAAVGAVGAMGVAGQANAYVYGLAHLEIVDLTIGVVGVTGVPITGPVQSFTFTNTNTAFFGGGAATFASCNQFTCPAVSPVLDAGPANGTSNTVNRVNNVFTFLGPNGVDSFAGSDSVINTAELTQGVPTSTRQIAESQLNVNGTAFANAEIQSNTTLVWTTVIPVDGATLTLAFRADPDFFIEINDIPGIYSAQANIQATFGLNRNEGGVTVQWKPDGTAANNCLAAGATCVEDADTQNLNISQTIGANPSSFAYSYDAGQNFTSFGITVSGLPAGTYSISLSALTSNNLSRIPEPGTIALLGAALAGIGFASRRKSKQA